MRPLCVFSVVGVLLGTSIPGRAEAEETATRADDETSESSEGEHFLELGGALRFNYIVRSWDEANLAQGGQLVFDTFRLNMALSYKRLIAAAEYRFYGRYGDFLKLGWLGYRFDERFEVHFGVDSVPFGLLPYASHNWFFNLGYYSGLEDDHDLGATLHYRPGDFDLRLGYFHSDEGSYRGESLDSARYSYDLVRVAELRDGDGNVVREASALVERHQGALRLTWSPGALDGALTVGASGLVGGIFDETSYEYGNQWSAAVHARGNWRWLDGFVELSRTERTAPAGSGPADGLWMGAYDSPYRVARRFTQLVTGVALTVPLDVGLLESVRFYDDLGLMLKDEGADSYQNVIGALLSAHYVYTYFDFAFGRNQPWMGGDWESALAEGDPDARWELRFNVNVGLYYSGLIPLPH